MLTLSISLQSLLWPRPQRDERGQATAEYALVLLGVAAVALLVLAWATKTGRIGDLLDAVLDKVRGGVDG